MADNDRLTWGRFKAAVEAAGVKDEDEIQYIDITTGFAEIEVRREEGCGWEVTG